MCAVPSQLKVLVPQAGGRQLDGPGRNPLQRVVPKGAAVGTGGHDPLFGADDLPGFQFPAPDTVGTAGFD